MSNISILLYSLISSVSGLWVSQTNDNLYNLSRRDTQKSIFILQLDSINRYRCLHYLIFHDFQHQKTVNFLRFSTKVSDPRKVKIYRFFTTQCTCEHKAEESFGRLNFDVVIFI